MVQAEEIFKNFNMKLPNSANTKKILQTITYMKSSRYLPI